MDLGDPSLVPVRVLGQGTFGRVFLCKYRSDRQKEGRMVCVKRIIVQNPQSEMSMIKEEVYIISQLRHPHIVRFLHYFVHAGTVNIVMEYMPNGTLRDVVTRNAASGRPLDKTRILHFFCDMLIGLEYLHIRHVIHRDIKPENMLLDAQDRVKIADFGISLVHAPSKQRQQVIGTPLYMAPEIMRGEKFCFKSDIWSLGCVLYELCMSCNPFEALLAHDSKDIKQLSMVVHALTQNKLDCHVLKQRYGPAWSRICEQMIVYDVERRIALPDVLTLDPSVTLTVYRQYFNYKY